MLGTILTVLLILFFMCGIALTAAVTVYVIKEIMNTYIFREDFENFIRCEKAKLIDEFDKL